MASATLLKRGMHHIPILIAFAIVLLVIYIVTRPGSSFIARATGWISNAVEGFATSSVSTPRCPTGYKFFNDSVGESFCCNGKINPYTHTCTGTGQNPICAFKPGVKTPTGGTYPLCSALITQRTETVQKESCPTGLPNYATVGKCCKHATDLDGIDCASIDAPKTNYCKLKGPLEPGEQLCTNLQLSEMARCPTAMSLVGYKFGDRELQKYNIVANHGEDAKQFAMPVCFSMEHSCIPNNVVNWMKSANIYTDKPANWIYNCDAYTKRYINRDFATPMDESYP
jgi:hypothetical protein